MIRKEYKALASEEKKEAKKDTIVGLLCFLGNIVCIVLALTL